VLFLPLAWTIRKQIPSLLAGILVCAAPWYALCYAANGEVFLREFIWRHHVQRFFETTLEHVQPFWFYLPVLAGGFFPWSPLLVLIPVRKSDPRLRQLFAFCGFGLLFFSISQNKLPGYILPLLPAIAILMAVGLAAVPNANRWLAACAVLLTFVPLIGQILPEALLSGLSRTSIAPQSLLAGLLWLALPAALLWLRPRVTIAFSVTLFAAAAAILVLKLSIAPALDVATTVRPFWRHLDNDNVCLAGVRRPWQYGLNYYAGRSLPDCVDAPSAVPIRDSDIRAYQVKR
jgi:4-amino-4-deoxy-L-arabinose transferase-like glycosyltransferase